MYVTIKLMKPSKQRLVWEKFVFFFKTAMIENSFFTAFGDKNLNKLKRRSWGLDYDVFVLFGLFSNTPPPSYIHSSKLSTALNIHQTVFETLQFIQEYQR